jgi:hypothetical protein
MGAERSEHDNEASNVRQSTRSRLQASARRSVWLPEPVYAAIPWIYLTSGTLSLLGGLYLPEWAWQLPYALLFGIACLHTGVHIARLRRRARQRRNEAREQALT